jgi:uncharacterized membrane protein
MLVFLAGLVVFLGVHSLRILAPSWREARIASWGEMRWKALVALASLAGLALLVLGYGMARKGSPLLWPTPGGMRHATLLLMTVAFILTAAAYVPGTHLRRWTRMPMTLGVALWSAGHLLANSSLADVLLFGAFLLWSLAILAFGRGPARPAPAAGGIARDAIAVAAGVAAGALFAHFLHAPLIGVDPFHPL